MPNTNAHPLVSKVDSYPGLRATALAPFPKLTLEITASPKLTSTHRWGCSEFSISTYTSVWPCKIEKRLASHGRQNICTWLVKKSVQPKRGPESRQGKKLKWSPGNHWEWLYFTFQWKSLQKYAELIKIEMCLSLRCCWRTVGCDTMIVVMGGYTVHTISQPHATLYMGQVQLSHQLSITDRCYRSPSAWGLAEFPEFPRSICCVPKAVYFPPRDLWSLPSIIIMTFSDDCHS